MGHSVACMVSSPQSAPCAGNGMLCRQRVCRANCPSCWCDLVPMLSAFCREAALPMRPLLQGSSATFGPEALHQLSAVLVKFAQALNDSSLDACDLHKPPAPPPEPVTQVPPVQPLPGSPTGEPPPAKRPHSSAVASVPVSLLGTGSVQAAPGSAVSQHAATGNGWVAAAPRSNTEGQGSFPGAGRQSTGAATPDMLRGLYETSMGSAGLGGGSQARPNTLGLQQGVSRPMQFPLSQPTSIQAPASASLQPYPMSQAGAPESLGHPGPQQVQQPASFSIANFNLQPGSLQQQRPPHAFQIPIPVSQLPHDGFNHLSQGQ